MAVDKDPSDFIDPEFQTARRAASTAGVSPVSPRAPSREEVEAKVTNVQAELAQLRQEQETLERERAALEETRRRQAEWQTGRAEMDQNLTRSIGLLEKAEFDSRQEADQMAKALAGLRSAIQNVQSISEDQWTKDNFQTEITRALTTLENARLELHSAQLKFPLLTGKAAAQTATHLAENDDKSGDWRNLEFFDLCRIGLALTWPIALAGLGILLVLLFRGK